MRRSAEPAPSAGARAMPRPRRVPARGRGRGVRHRRSADPAADSRPGVQQEAAQATRPAGRQRSPQSASRSPVASRRVAAAAASGSNSGTGCLRQTARLSRTRSLSQEWSSTRVRLGLKQSGVWSPASRGGRPEPPRPDGLDSEPEAEGGRARQLLLPAVCSLCRSRAEHGERGMFMLMMLMRPFSFLAFTVLCSRNGNHMS
jgi:hypothetical protein